MLTQLFGSFATYQANYRRTIKEIDESNKKPQIAGVGVRLACARREPWPLSPQAGLIEI